MVIPTYWELSSESPSKGTTKSRCHNKTLLSFRYLVMFGLEQSRFHLEEMPAYSEEEIVQKNTQLSKNLLICDELWCRNMDFSAQNFDMVENN